ncbi:MAG: UDP-N-acetylmuramoyl-L-alanine--D-glutamate ligase [Streptococcaceae bacterium]|jgi:UDP-N-acetylmuramoylalanine--D-glutamate ligase|nr:UDP-N-acetylmuramoyl-L-alanine--D-glutamate ligase [Streptococcaceae bacterium]
MKRIKNYENKKVLVLGLARSGFSATKLLNELGAMVTVNDGKPLAENPQAQDLIALGVRVITGGHPLELLDEAFELVVKNPGIPYSNPLIEKALGKSIPVITEVELAYQVNEGMMIAITGTNGKTTTTTMIDDILISGGKSSFLAGNIGFPASMVAEKVAKDGIMVTELSSFQLMGIQTLAPQIAVITNLSSAHLDYHGTREAYIKAKWRIQENQTAKDYLVLNFNQEELVQLAKTSKATIVPFSTQQKVDGAYLLAGNLYFKEELIISADEIGVPGLHNIENALAAIATAKLIGIKTQVIRQVLAQFSGVKHRTQYLGEINGVKFYNDSKATNILATQMALSGFDNSKLFLLAGGLDRGNSFDALILSLKGLKGLFVFGETKDKLVSAGKAAGIDNIQPFETLTEATNAAYQEAQTGEIILLSPANASWDQYPTFEVRGDEFISLFQAFKGEK